MEVIVEKTEKIDGRRRIGERLTEQQKQLAADNVKLVHCVIQRKYAWMNANQDLYDDCVQAGSQALIRAARCYKANFNFKFSTYAYNAISLDVSRYLAERMRAGRNEYCIDNVDAVDDSRPFDWIDTNDAITALRRRLSQRSRHILDMRLSGMTYRQIGVKTGISGTRIEQIINQKIRPQLQNIIAGRRRKNEIDA